jgi:hypothetical protein
MGIAKEKSKPNGLLMKENLIRGNIEMKDSYHVPLRQAYIYGISTAFQLYKNGYTHENLMVPVSVH